MTPFKLHNLESRPQLAAVQEKFGFVPNLLGMLAESPVAADAYLKLGELFANSSFTPVEQQVVTLTVSNLHECDYCMAAHSGLAEMADMAPEVLEALRAGRTLPDARLEALRTFATTVVVERGLVGDLAVAAFLDAGYTKAQVLEVITGVAFKTISNHITRTPLDRPFSKYAWEKKSA